MEALEPDTNTKLLPSHENDLTEPTKMRAFSIMDGNQGGQSRSRLQSRQNYRHYTQSIYSEISKAKEMAVDQEDGVESMAFAKLKEIDSMRIVRSLKIVGRELECRYYLEDLEDNSRGFFQDFGWTLASNNAFYFSCKSDLITSINKSKIPNGDANFTYYLKEDSEKTKSADIYIIVEGNSEKLGSVVKQEFEGQGETKISDANGSLIYKIVEDNRPSSDVLGFILLNLMGNSVGSGDIICEGDDRLTCKINFPDGTGAKQKILILTSFIFKMMLLGLGIPLQDDVLSTDSCFFCLFKTK